MDEQDVCALEFSLKVNMLNQGYSLCTAKTLESSYFAVLKVPPLLQEVNDCLPAALLASHCLGGHIFTHNRQGSLKKV